jgi:DNA-binding NarL/FixJ family response regulator
MMHILTVHDSPISWVDLLSFLRCHVDCCIVGEVNRLEDVLSLAQTERTDIVLLDSDLTSADPFEVTRRLRELEISAIMVIASLQADEEELFQFLKCGATAYESRFASGEEVLAKLRRMYSGECLVTSDTLLAESSACTNSSVEEWLLSSTRTALEQGIRDLNKVIDSYCSAY